jgi:ABC-2 type transport system permease protein
VTGLWMTAKLDLAESFRARWFLVYSLVFGGALVLLLLSGLAESRVMGFSGLSRILIIYVQLCMAILPVFILLTTVRSVAGDREAGVIEYLLALPVSLSGWYWGKLTGRFVVVFAPVFLAMAAAAVFAALRGYGVPWTAFALNAVLLVSLIWCFLGIGILISSLTHSSDIAQGAAFVVWLTLLLFIDVILLGIMIREQIPAELVIGVSLMNPLQAFRVASMTIFDPALMLMGPSSHIILDALGVIGVQAYGIIYPVVLGSISAMIGYRVFRRGDLI